MDAMQMQAIEDITEIVCQRADVVAVFWVRGGARASTREADYLKPVDQLRREIVEDVGAVPEAGQQNERFPAAAPVQHLEPGRWVNRHEPHSVWRGIAPAGRRVRPRVYEARGEWHGQ